MQKDHQACSIKGHERQRIAYICTYKQCQLTTRFICEECIKKKLHSHGSKSKMVKLEDFSTYLVLNVKPKMVQMKNEAKRIPQFIQEINQMIGQLQNISKQHENYLLHLEEVKRTYKLSDRKLLAFDQKQLNDLINIDDSKIDYLLMQNEVQKIISQCQGLNKEFANYSYVPHFQIQGVLTRSPMISQNEQYLSLLVGDRRFRINQLKNNKMLVSKQQKNYCERVKFSIDSKFLFICDARGHFRQFSNKHGFKQIFYKKQFNPFIRVIRDFIQIDKNQVAIVCEQICIFDIARRRQLLSIDTQAIVNCIEFDCYNNLFVTVLEGKSIQIFRRKNGKMIIRKPIAAKKRISQIKLMNKGQNILSSNKYSLCLWQVDLQKKRLEVIREFHFDVQYFNIVYQDQRIIMRNKDQLIITDNNFNILYETNIKGQRKFDISLHHDQLQSMNYIIVHNNLGLKILKNERNQ